MSKLSSRYILVGLLLIGIVSTLGLGWSGEDTVRTEDGWPAGEFLFPFGVAVTPDEHTVIEGDT